LFRVWIHTALKHDKILVLLQGTRNRVLNNWRLWCSTWKSYGHC